MAILLAAMLDFAKRGHAGMQRFSLCGQYVAVPTVCIVSLKDVSGKQAWQDRFLKDMAKYRNRNHTYQALLSILKPSSLPSVFDVQNGYASQYASPYAVVSLLPGRIDGSSLSCNSLACVSHQHALCHHGRPAPGRPKRYNLPRSVCHHLVKNNTNVSESPREQARLA